MSPILFTVKFDVTPSDAAVEVGGYEGQSGYVVKTPNEDGSYSLQAGTGYVLKITAELYKSLETEFDVTGDATLRYTLTADHTFADNGFCTVCNVYNPDAEGYTVSTQEQLAAIAAAVNGGDTLAGKTVALANDLTLNGAWTPIGGETTAVSLTLGSQEDLDAALKEHAIIYDNTGASYVPNSDKNGSYDENRTYYYLNGAAFGGVFDGGKHEIGGLNVDTDAGYAGLFGNVSGTVKNLTVRGSVKTATSKDFVGGIVGKLSADKLSTPFVDVPVTDGKNVYYAEAVAWAAENGIVNGVDATHFAPDDEVTREQIAAILFRYAEKKGVDTTKRADLSSFPDAKAVSAYAENAVAWAVASGLVNGIKDGANALLAPQGNATRAQVAVILMRYAN